MDKRTLSLAICDYQQRVLCSLYDNESNVSGQAEDVFVTTERNGWKELSFSLPSVCQTEDGTEENYRLEYLKADYLICLTDNNETDWFIISEPKITHESWSKKVDVTAGHISQLLKIKNYGLEFSDKEGNNVGTAEELLTTILDGTGWSVGHVYPFAEKTGKTKYRSLKASTKTGAFKLITTLCDLFEAKPVYHGGTRTVDLLPINPFSQPKAGMLPDLSLADEVVELHYGKNLSNVSRTLNTENIVTKLYAYGSYGDKTNGYCGIDECTHTEYIYTVTADCAVGTYWFDYEDETNVRVVKHFAASTPIKIGDVLIFSTMDPSTMLYIWNETQGKMYPVYSGTDGTELPSTVEKKNDVKNWFQFIMNFDYYREVGLLTDDMLQIVADYQRNAPKMFEKISEASAKMSDARTKLSQTIGYVDFCRLDIDRDEELLDDTYITLVLNKKNYSDGVIYRTDYDQIKKNQFKWRATDSLNKDGDPINSAAGIVYILHNTNPITWDKAYLKKVFNEDNPDAITLWAARGSIAINPQTDKFYLFAYNSINGRLGTLESADESACKALTEATKLVTVEHPVLFINSKNLTSELPELNGYGWRWIYHDDKTASDFHFCYQEEGDTAWHNVMFQAEEPLPSIGRYWYDWRNSVLYRADKSGWKLLDTASEKRVAALFPTVYMYGKTRDKYYQGLSMNYTYKVPSGQTLPAGNYFIENEYNSYWAVTTQEELEYGDSLYYNYDNGWITQVKNKVETQLSSKAYRFDNVSYHSDNLLANREVEEGNLNEKGELVETTEKCKTQGYYTVVPKTQYQASNSSISATVHYYDDKKRWISCEAFTSTFTTPSDCGFICIVFDVMKTDFDALDYQIAAIDRDNLIIIKDLNYKRLLPIETSGDNVGILSLMDLFSSISDLTYQTYYAKLKQLQDELKSIEKNMTASIGDLYREGWWQDDSYVDGDEQKLYDDALKNLNVIAKPEATYSIKYLDLYDANENNADFGVNEATTSTMWPDITMASAVHLIDPDIAINTWAYFDKIKKCYDQPKKTTISINTNLSTISQHSFGDVMTNIANVASRMKGNESYYDKTLSSAASKDDMEDVGVDVVKNEKQLNNTIQNVEQIGDTLITHETSLIQTQNEIVASAERFTNDTNRLSSSLRIAANSITQEVKRAKGAEKTLSGKIETTEKNINLSVEKVINGDTPVQKVKNTSVNLDTDGINMTGGKIKMGAETSIEMTAGAENGASLSVKHDGIQMSGGKIDIRAKDASSDTDNAVEIGTDGISMKAGTSFSAESGGTVKINAENGEGSYITLGEMFSVTKEKGIIAGPASFTSANVQGNAVVTTDTLSQRVIVSKSQPTKSADDTRSIIWLEPNATAEVKYRILLDANRNVGLRFDESHNFTQTKVLSEDGEDTLPDGDITYAIDFMIYMISQAGQADKETNLQAAITLQKGNQSVAFDPISIPIIRIWESVTLQASVTTKINLCSNSEPITMTVILSSPQTYSLYMKENSYINLTCKNPKTSSEDMICKVHFIP